MYYNVLLKINCVLYVATLLETNNTRRFFFAFTIHVLFINGDDMFIYNPDEVSIFVLFTWQVWMIHLTKHAQLQLQLFNYYEKYNYSDQINTNFSMLPWLHSQNHNII